MSELSEQLKNQVLQIELICRKTPPPKKEKRKTPYRRHTHQTIELARSACLESHHNNMLFNIVEVPFSQLVCRFIDICQFVEQVCSTIFIIEVSSMCV